MKYRQLALLPLFVSSLAWADEKQSPIQEPEVQSSLKIHCPDPSLIVTTSVPFSIHTAFTATTDEGYGFGAFTIAYAEPTSMSFYKAEVSAINDYWRYYCAYEKGGAGLVLSTRDRPRYAECHFPDGKQQCEGSIEECVLICPADSIPPDSP